jgi:hypothetical protein
MNRNILKTGAAVVAAVLLTAFTVPAPAQASADPNHGSDVHVIAPPAPSGSRPAAAHASLATASPSISPSAYEIWVPPGYGYGCPIDNLCVAVWDPNYLWTNGQGGAILGVWAVFFLYSCQEYELSNWYGDGYYLDNQRPAGLRGVKSYFRNQFHNTIGSPITPDGTEHGPYNWTPVWYIKNC